VLLNSKLAIGVSLFAPLDSVARIRACQFAFRDDRRASGLMLMVAPIAPLEQGRIGRLQDVHLTDELEPIAPKSKPRPRSRSQPAGRLQGFVELRAKSTHGNLRRGAGGRPCAAHLNRCAGHGYAKESLHGGRELESGNLPMSSAEIASTIPSEFFLMSKLFCKEARMPVTVISDSSSLAAAAAGAAKLGIDTAVKESVEAPPRQMVCISVRRRSFGTAFFI
jgi:hypothetical protein